MADNKLERYRTKRDFKKTSEPSGETVLASGEKRRFVIQKHAATRLHYDLRLELDGVFKSWAVTRGPSMDPQDKRLAVEVEDHPLDYGDFEGTIPKGEYGGGTVQLWDRGYWAPEGMTPEDGLAKGDLKFVLVGERLQGSWVLVRMKHDRTGSKRTNWLLIKHRDEFVQDQAAVGAMMEEDRSIASGRKMEAIAAGKGKAPKPFMRVNTVKVEADAKWNSNKGLATETETSENARPKLPPRKTAKTLAAIPDFISPQLCETVDRPPSGAEWVHEIKLDGYRLQLRVQDGKVTLKSRFGIIY